MHTISNKQAIANKKTARKESLFCEARAADLRPGKTLAKGGLRSSIPEQVRCWKVYLENRAVGGSVIMMMLF
jgi:hypothetical protein